MSNKNYTQVGDTKTSIDYLGERKKYNLDTASGLLGGERFKSLPSDYVSVRGLTKNDIKLKIEKMRDCSSMVDVFDMGDHYRVHSADFCKQPVFCSACARRASSLRQIKFAEPIKALAKKCTAASGADRLYAYMITFTIKDTLDLFGAVSHLKKSMANFRSMGQTRINGRTGEIKTSSGEWGKVIAAVGSVEVKRGEGSGLAHAHAHILSFCDSPLDYQVYDRYYPLLKEYFKDQEIPQYLKDACSLHPVEYFDGEKMERFHSSKISREWFASTGDSYMIEVTALRKVPFGVSESKKLEYSAMKIEDSIFLQSREVLKYAAKINPTDPDFTLSVISDTANIRFFESWRLFRNMEDDNLDDSELSDPSMEKYPLIRLRWKHDGTGYFLDRSVIDSGQKVVKYQGELLKTMKKQGAILGKYRRDRALFLKYVDYDRAGSVLSERLDRLRSCVRSRVADLWRSYKYLIVSELYGGSRVRIATSSDPFQSYEMYKFGKLTEKGQDIVHRAWTAFTDKFLEFSTS